MNMSASRKSSADDERIDQEAAEWFVRRDAGLNAEEQAAFDQWLAADRRHADRFERHRSTWERFSSLRESDLEEAVGTGTARVLDRRSPSFWRWAAVLGSLAASLVAGWSLWLTWSDASRSAKQAEPLEIRAVAYENRILADGSIIELNVGTRVRVQFTEGERSVWLLGGEAHFDVAPEPLRPFVVYADGATVRAVGTAFNVRVGGKAIEVLVTEGKVRVAPIGTKAEAESAQEMTARQHSTLPRGAEGARPQVETLTQEEVGELLAWKPTTLEFSGAPLGDVVTAFNKRNEVQMSIKGDDLAKLPVELSFHSENVEAFTRMLELTFDIRSERRGKQEIVLYRVR